MRILVTCFEPFGGNTENASQLVVDHLARSWTDPSVGLVTQTMSVAYEAGMSQLTAAVNRVRPDAILSVGEDDLYEWCTVERVGRNLADGQFAGRPSVALVPLDDGPPQRECTFDADEVSRRMQSAGVRTELSDDAGTFMCNAFAYLLPTFGVPAGFVHVPAVRSTDPGRVERLARGIAAAVTSLRHQVEPAQARVSQADVSD